MPVAPLQAVAEFQAELLPALQLSLPDPRVFAHRVEGEQPEFRGAVDVANSFDPLHQPAVALHRYPAQTVVNGESIEPHVVAVGAALVREQCPDWAERHDELAAALYRSAMSADVVQAPCLLAARYGDVTWGHWLCELLPKIVLAEALFPKTFTYVVPARITRLGGPIGDGYVRAVMQSLQAYGIDDYRLFRVSPDMALRFDSLFDLSGIFPVAGLPIFGLHPGLIQHLRLRAVAPAMKTPRRPFIVREAAGSRGLVNRDDLIEQARAFGYQPVSMRTLSFVEQIAMFRNADAIAAELGSGLAAYVHAPLGGRLITVAPADWFDFYFVNMFRKQGCAHADVRGVSSLDRGEVASSSYSVETKAFRAGLDALHQDL